MRIDDRNDWFEIAEIAHLNQHPCVRREETLADRAAAEVEGSSPTRVEGSLGIDLGEYRSPASDARVSCDVVELVFDTLGERVFVTFKNLEELGSIHFFEVRHHQLVLHSEGDRQHAVSS